MADRFTFDAYTWDAESGHLVMRYGFDSGEIFEEHLQFHPPFRHLNSADQQALDRAFRFLFLLAGVSYYKAKCPPELECRAFDIDQVTARLVEKIYYHGLGEFAYRNGLELRDRIRFINVKNDESKGVPLDLPHHLLIPVGGGKDSIVTIEAMKQTALPIHLFGLGAPSGLADPIQRCIDVSNLPVVRVARTISPALIALNQQGAYNGHVPITAILSAITVVCTILYGFDTIILSNEHSASEPNVRVDGFDVNHQYSKSFDFEQDFAAYVHQMISPSIHYFSLLRPLSEVAIVKRFSVHTQYHSVFRSCNTAFKQDILARGAQWCGQCPKCHFVFLSLTPFLSKESIIEIFGKNLLSDSRQEQGFAELCGISSHKPFECVGEIEESAVLMALASYHKQWKNDNIVHSLSQKLGMSQAEAQQRFESLLALRHPHAVPSDFLKWIV